MMSRLSALAFIGVTVTGLANANSAAIPQDSVLEVLSGGRSASRLTALEDALQPMYQALPKNGHGRLNTATVRYALHRHFVKHYGWNVKGLAPAGERWDALSAEAVFQGRLPEHAQELLTRSLHERGLDLSELALFAATLVDHAHQDVIDDAAALYAVMGLPMHAHIMAPDVDSLLALFAAFKTFGQGALQSKQQLATALGDLQDGFPGWPDMQAFMLDLRATYEFLHSDRRLFLGLDTFTFQDVSSMFITVMEKYGSVSQDECLTMKEKLVELDQDGLGRAPLSDFYASPKFELKESVGYLQNLGALDDSDPERPSIIIPSYILAASNCVIEGSFVSVCCLDACEGLLGQIELSLSAPEAEPARIVEVVSSMSSDSAEAPRELSLLLAKRLDDIAALHQGMVPLHGRLFMQWLHHAFPRECPYPHEGGLHKPLEQVAWIKVAQVEDVLVTEEERLQYTKRGRVGHTLSLEDLPWSGAEELVAVHVQQKEARVRSDSTTSSRQVLRALACSVAVASFAFSLLQILWNACCRREPREEQREEKRTVYSI